MAPRRLRASVSVNEEASGTLSLSLRRYPHVRWPEQPRDREVVLMSDGRTSGVTASGQEPLAAD